MNETQAEKIVEHFARGCILIIQGCGGNMEPLRLKIFCATCQESLLTIDPLTEMNRNDKLWYQKEAKRIHEVEGTIEIDEGARLSPGEEGCYVQAWVWVPKLEQECPEENES